MAAIMDQDLDDMESDNPYILDGWIDPIQPMPDGSCDVCSLFQVTHSQLCEEGLVWQLDQEVTIDEPLKEEAMTLPLDIEWCPPHPDDTVCLYLIFEEENTQSSEEFEMCMPAVTLVSQDSVLTPVGNHKSRARSKKTGRPRGRPFITDPITGKKLSQEEKDARKKRQNQRAAIKYRNKRKKGSKDTSRDCKTDLTSEADIDLQLL